MASSRAQPPFRRSEGSHKAMVHMKRRSPGPLVKSVGRRDDAVLYGLAHSQNATSSYNPEMRQLLPTCAEDAG